MKQNSFLCSLLTMMMVAMLGIGFAACSDDDDDKGSGSSVVGLWSGSNPYNEDEHGTVLFKKDGTGSADLPSGTETKRRTFSYKMTSESEGVILQGKTAYFNIKIEDKKMYLYCIYHGELEWVLTKK